MLMATAVAISEFKVVLLSRVEISNGGYSNSQLQ